jgi:hypothetical protein
MNTGLYKPQNEYERPMRFLFCGFFAFINSAVKPKRNSVSFPAEMPAGSKNQQRITLGREYLHGSTGTAGFGIREKKGNGVLC